VVREKQGRDVAAKDGGAPDRNEHPSAEGVPLMRLAPGERFYKFYILTEATGRPDQRVEHRIISKEHADGSLEMVSYNAWFAGKHSEKRDVIRVASLPKALFDQVVARVRAQSEASADSFREIDLSNCETVEDQLRVLANIDL